MPSEFTPGGSGARMSAAQIKKLQEEQLLARKLAKENIAKAKKSKEWKKEQDILANLEETLDYKNHVVEITPTDKNISKKQKMTFLEELIFFLKTLFK